MRIHRKCEDHYVNVMDVKPDYVILCNYRSLPSDEAIDAFITSQITHFKEIREYIERLNGISEA
jgi:hypothetical protein